MIIIGQGNAKQVIKRLVINHEGLLHLLLIAPSGHGKTLLGNYAAKLIAYVKDKRIIYFSTGDSFMEFYNKKSKFRWEKYVVFIDEIHLLTDPEGMFPLFERTDIIGATNIAGLAEALENRFTRVPLQRYNEEELKEIFELYYGSEIDEETFNKFLRITSTPRRLKEYAKLYKSLGEDFWELMVSPEGLTPEEIEYIDALTALGGRSSFSRIRAYLGYSPKYVQQLEIRLLEKGKIVITNKGRELVTNKAEEDLWV